jgi:large subunit ribosomal protein L29
MKAKELRERSDEELAVELKTFREGLFRLSCREVTENTAHAEERNALKRDVARVLTIMREREIGRRKGD